MYQTATTSPKIQEKIKRKELEILEYETKIKEAKAYIQALQDSLKMVPRDDANGSLAESTLRPGSSIAKTCDFLKEIGKPMHINDILSGIGKGTSKKERTSLSGALGCLPPTSGCPQLDRLFQASFP